LIHGSFFTRQIGGPGVQAMPGVEHCISPLALRKQT